MTDESISDATETVRDISEKQDTISYEVHRKLLGQRKTDQAKMKDLEAKINSFVTEKTQNEEKKLAEQGEYKKLVENRDAEIARLNSENNEYKTSFDKAIKLSAFRDRLGGTVDNSQYYDFVNVDNIVIDPESGTVDDASVEMVVNEFKQNHSKLFTPKGGKVLPSDAPSTNDPTLKPFEKLSEDEKMKIRMGIVKDKFY